MRERSRNRKEEGVKWAETASLPLRRTRRKVGLFTKEHSKALNLEGGKNDVAEKAA